MSSKPEMATNGNGFGVVQIRSATLLLIFASVLVNNLVRRPIFAGVPAGTAIAAAGANASSPSHVSSRGRRGGTATREAETRVQTEPMPRRTDVVASPPHVDPAEAHASEGGVVDVLPDDPRCKLVLDPGSESAEDEMYRLEEEEFGGDKGAGIGKPDKFSLGPCRYFYPQRVKPERGYTSDIDWFFFRTMSPEIERREGCFVRCLELMEKMERKFVIGPQVLAAAAFMGLTETSRVLVERHGLDPIVRAGTAGDGKNDKKRKARRALGNANDYRLNAMQAALTGGYVDVVKVLSGGDYSRIIDDHNRTVEDYVRLRGSPVRPYYARTVLGIDVKDDDHDKKSAGLASEERKMTSKYPDDGWNNTMARPIDYSCDFEVVDTDAVDLDRDTFLRDYYLPGRPVVLRNAVSKEEMSTFTKSAWEKLHHFHPKKKHRVGVTAYPSLSMQESCSYDMSAEQLERDERCRDTPNLHMMHAEHRKHFDEAYGMHGGDPCRPGGGFARLAEYFPGVGHGWQIFHGSDMSGATIHWHAAAFNILYVGVSRI